MAGLLSTRGRSAVAGPKGAALLSATTLPAWLQGKAIGEWVSIPNTALADMDFSVINAAGLNPGNWQYGSPQKGIFAYSGGCVKGGNSLLLFGGGGANAWAGNEVRAIDLSADVPKWTVLIPPSPASAVWSNVNGSPEKTPHAYNKDDKPNARHSYWQPQFIDADNEFMAFGCTNEWETDSIKSLVVDSYSLNKGSWNAQGTNPAMPHRRGWDGNAQCKHPVTEDVFIAAGGYLSRWSRASNTWTDIRTVHSGMERGMMAVDPNANIVLRLGLNAPSNPCFKFDCDTGAMTPGNLVGPYAAAVNLSDAPHWGASGFTYDRGLKAFLLYQNTGQIYVLTPSGSDWNVDLLPTFGTLPEINADMSAALGGGIWGRFAYLPALNGVVFVSGTVSPPYRQNVFFVRTGQFTGSGIPVVDNYQGLWWAVGGAESGWGINLAHQSDVIFATWFTYDANGKAWWLSMTANRNQDGSYSGTLYQTNGPAFNAVPFDPGQVTRTAVGSGTLAFSSASSGKFDYTVNGIAQSKAIVLGQFGPLPTCAWGTQPDLSVATNYQDLWSAAPADSESGWGINLTQQGTTIFGTWFTYDVNRSPLWYSVTAPQAAPNTFTGTLYRTTGPPFSAIPFNPDLVTRTSVGTVTLTFTNGNAGRFDYQVNDGANMATQSKAITRLVFRNPGTVCQ